MTMENYMPQLDYLIFIYAGFLICVAFCFLIAGYIMGRKTRTDEPVFRERFNTDDGKEPEQDEIQRCLSGEQQ